MTKRWTKVTAGKWVSTTGWRVERTGSGLNLVWVVYAPDGAYRGQGLTMPEAKQWAEQLAATRKETA